MNDTHAFLSIIGIGEDGVDLLSARARDLIGSASLVVGGRRHLGLAAPLIRGERMVWPSPIEDVLPMLAAFRPKPVVALASGDPFCFGVGPMLARAFPDFVCLPAISCLSLACAGLGWAQQDAAVISFCGRPIEPLRPMLHDGARILALSADATTPAAVAAFLTAQGFGPSTVTVLEALGGPRERIRRAAAQEFSPRDIDDLNMMAIEVVASETSRAVPRASGLTDAWFDNDGQLTKKEVRAVTLAALSPVPGEMLWDIGLGSGSVAIEWLLQDPSMQALGVERDPARAVRAKTNAVCLGVPRLRVIEGAAPACLAGLPLPDAIFIGGGATEPGMIEAALSALRPRGRLVVNAVTMETQAVLFDAVTKWGGSLTRLGIERLDTVGQLHGFRPAMAVVQWALTKL